MMEGFDYGGVYLVCWYVMNWIKSLGEATYERESASGE